MQIRNNPLWRLLPYINQQARLYWGAIAVLHASRLVEVIVPLFLKSGIDLIAKGDANLGFPVFMIISLAVLRYSMLKYGRATVRQQGARIAAALRRDLFASLQRQGRGFYGSYSTGDLMARAISDISIIQQLLGLGLAMTMMLGLTGVAALLFMSLQSPSLTLLLFPVLPLLLFIASSLAKRIHAQSASVQQRFSQLSTHVIENLNGIRTIQSHAQEEREIARFDHESQAYAVTYQGMTVSTSRLAAWMVIASGIVTLIVVSVGGRQVLSGTISIGTLAAFLFYLTLLLGQLRQSSQPISNVQRARAASARLFEILDAPPEIQETPDARPLPAIHGKISLHNLSYTYPAQTQSQNKPTLNGLCLDIKAGETVAILGRVGSGKSTLLRLLARLHEPTTGTAKLDGQPLASIPLAQLRSSVCLVPQDAFLFATQLAENIAYDDPTRPPERIQHAALAAGLGSTLELLRDGLETQVGERGVTLSGGQKQRIGLARGLIREAPVLLLDDCCSAVDSETETFILGQLRQHRQGQTTVLVTHRVSAARHADRIVILDEGQIVEHGSHEELIRAEGFYAKLAQLQHPKHENTAQTLEHIMTTATA